MKGEEQLSVLCMVRTLARLGNVNRHLATQRLRECGVRRFNVGRGVLIPMAEIEKQTPLLFQSLQRVTPTCRQREEGKWQ